MAVSAQTGARRSDSIGLVEQRSASDDHLVRRDGVAFAGEHLIIDVWGGHGLDDRACVEAALRRMVAACRATLLHIHLHPFDSGGVSGVAVLAESHISVHTWPELDYAAFDIFMCGDAEPAAAIPVLESAFEPRKVDVSTHRRGMITE